MVAFNGFVPDVKFVWLMRLVVLLAVLLLAAAVAALLCSCERDEGTLKYSSLPQEARAFVETCFPGIMVERCTWERDNGVRTYDVRLLDGTEIEFDSSGRWTEVDCNFGFLPSGVLPEAISSDIAARYPSSAAHKVERMSGGYEVSIYSGGPYTAFNVFYTDAGVFVRAVPDF